MGDIEYYGQFIAGLIIAIGACIVASRPGVATWVRVLLFIAYAFGLIIFRLLFTHVLDIQTSYGMFLDTMWSIVAIFVFWFLVAMSNKKERSDE